MIRGLTIAAARSVPVDLGVALAQVQRAQLRRLLELLALGAGGRQLHQRGDARRRELGAGELGVLERGELGREAVDAVAREQQPVGLERSAARSATSSAGACTA